MTEKPRPVGQRFSHVYLERGNPMDDSVRMRRRMASAIANSDHLGSFQGYLREELGIETLGGGYESEWINFLEKRCELRDLLDIPTLAFRFMEADEKNRSRSYYFGNGPKFMKVLQRIFDEENVHYEIDAHGGVHFKYDTEFALNENATIATLRAGRYANALQEFNKSHEAYSQATPDGKTAIRAVFASAECIFKLILPKQIRLGAKEAQALEPILSRIYNKDDVAKRAAMKMLGSFKEWADSAHFYRHEEGVEEPSQPPLQLAMLITSNGASFIRWLADIDSQNGGGKEPTKTE